MEMGVSRGVYEQRNRRERVGDRERLMFQSSAVLSSHPTTLTRHRRKLLSLKSWLLLDAISAHLKFFSEPLLFPLAHAAVSH